MATLATFRVAFDGRQVGVLYEIPPDAHMYGLSGKKWLNRHVVPFGDLTGNGADIIEDCLTSAVANLVAELHGAWDTVPMF